MSLESDLRDLVRVPLFSTLEREALRLLAFSAETKHFAKDEVIFEAADPSDCGYFLLKGSVTLRDPASEQSAWTVAAPALLGEMALLTETDRSVTATPSTSITTLRISRALFQRVLKEHPRSASNLRGFVEGRLAVFAGKLDSLGTSFSSVDDL